MTSIRAHAKATLTLRVIGRRADGYHDIDALTVALSEPYDDLVVEAASAIELTVIGDDTIPVDEGNLAWRAAQAAGASVSIRLHKQIPAEAGLGGGSADAAALLRALDAPAAVAAAVGSDVMSCYVGGLVRMRGRGDIVDPILDVTGDFAVVVAVPPFRLSTPRVYAMWDELGAPAARRRLAAPRSLLPYTDALFNDLEPAAECIEPGIVAWREQMEGIVGGPGLMAGSGSAYLFVTDGAPKWTPDLAVRMRDGWPGTQVWIAHPVTNRLG